MPRFINKTAIVTGAASGIGLALSTELAREGARVIMADIDKTRVESACQNLIQGGYTVQSSHLDVTDQVAVRTLVEDIADEFNGLDYLFNNAGIAVYGEALDFGHDDWRRVIDVNLYGVIHGILAAYPIMAKRGSGHIINTASLAGLIPSPGLISYNASKYAVVGLSNTLRLEAAGRGVQVSVICPGFIDTPIFDNSKIINADKSALVQLLGKPMPPDECAKKILDGVRANKSMVFPSATARIIWWLQRASPALINSIVAVSINKMRSGNLK